jgi:chaperone required for assembly of F1-ATPase
MSGWTQKRFWTEARVAADGGGFTVELDGRRIRTPAKAALVLPTRAMAAAIAAEWQVQEKLVDPGTMPVTRSANAAIDKVGHQHREVAEMLAAYGDCDLLCYRAEAPDELVARQALLWDPALDWTERVLDARLVPRSGVTHRGQNQKALGRLSVRVHAFDPFQLAAFHDLVSLSGSLVLGFGAAMNWRDADEIWHLSRLDELWQEEQWGADDEASAMAQTKRAAFLHAKRFFDLA